MHDGKVCNSIDTDQFTDLANITLFPKRAPWLVSDVIETNHFTGVVNGALIPKDAPGSSRTRPNLIMFTDVVNIARMQSSCTAGSSRTQAKLITFSNDTVDVPALKIKYISYSIVPNSSETGSFHRLGHY